jgi:hypothetical protein
MNPYLSIVVASRNDNHGGDLNERTAAFMKNVYYQSKKWKVPTELIIVEWNPPANRPLLSEILPKPQSDTPVTLRYIIVPPEIHNRYIHSAYIPLYQMIAKNAGIRRAKGEFVLCTNVDILFSNECFKIISKKKLEKGKYYRANRCDVPKEAAQINDPEKQLAFCKKNIIKRLGKLRGAEGIDELSYLFFFRYLAITINYLSMKLWHMTHPGKFPHFTLDTTACGDFTLMSKQDWLDIEGYVELDMYSIHVDSMALWAAQALGKKQEVLDGASCVYHISHDNGWESEDALKTIRFISQKPCIDYGLVLKGGFQIIKQRQTWGLNHANWGFADIELEEISFNETVTTDTSTWKK